jgi:hypothetical protein
VRTSNLKSEVGLFEFKDITSITTRHRVSAWAVDTADLPRSQETTFSHRISTNILQYPHICAYISQLISSIMFLHQNTERISISSTCSACSPISHFLI